MNQLICPRRRASIARTTATNVRATLGFQFRSARLVRLEEIRDRQVCAPLDSGLDVSAGALMTPDSAHSNLAAVWASKLPRDRTPAGGRAPTGRTVKNILLPSQR